jgi:hypothetical protein
MSQLVTQALEIASLCGGDRARSSIGHPGCLPESRVEFRGVPDLAGGAERTICTDQPVSA